MESKKDLKQINEQDFNISITNEHNDQDITSISEGRTTKSPASGLNKNSNTKQVNASFSKINKLNRNKYGVYENPFYPSRFNSNNIIYKGDSDPSYSKVNNAKNINSLYRSKSNQSIGNNELYIEVSNNYIIKLSV